MSKPLPKLKRLEYNLQLPLSKQTLIFRPYSVEDERLLLQAAESKASDSDFYLRNTFNVLRGTVVNDVDIDKLPSVEVALFMLNLRGKSVGEEIEFNFKEDGKLIKASCNVADFKIVTPPEYVESIQLDEAIWIKMMPINFAKEIEYAEKFKDEKTAVIFESIYDSVHSIYTTDDVWVVGEDITRDDLVEFINGAQGVTTEFYNYLKNRPYLAVDCVMQDGTTRTITSEEADFLSSPSAT